MTADAGFNPYQSPPSEPQAAAAEGPVQPPSLTQQFTAAISFLMVFGGMNLIGLFLAILTAGLGEWLAGRPAVIWASVVFLLWTPVSVFVAALNHRMVRRMQKNKTL